MENSESFFRNNFSTHFDNNNDTMCYAVDCYDAMNGFAKNIAIEFSKWLMIYCDYRSHCVWEYQGTEFTQNELFEIFLLSRSNEADA